MLEEGCFEKPILFGGKMAAKQDWLLLFKAKVFPGKNAAYTGCDSEMNGQVSLHPQSG